MKRPSPSILLVTRHPPHATLSVRIGNSISGSYDGSVTGLRWIVVGIVVIVIELVIGAAYTLGG